LTLYLLVGGDLPSLRDLANFVVPRVSSKWYHLGVQLIDSKHVTILDNLRADITVKGLEERCTEMFKEWLRTEDKDKATWSKVILGLRSKAVRLENVANDIEKMLNNHVSINSN